MSIETEADVDGDSPDAAGVEDLAASLGEAIADTTEYERFEEAREAVEADEEAQERIRTFEQLRREFALARQTGEATQEDVEQVRQAQQELHDLPVMDEYVAAQQALESRLEAVNDAISEPLAVDFGDQASGCCED